MAKFVCLTPSWVIAKAVKVAAEMSSNSYDIKNRIDVFPVRCSVIDSQKPPWTETLPAVVKFLSVGVKVRLSHDSSKCLWWSRQMMHLLKKEKKRKIQNVINTTGLKGLSWHLCWQWLMLATSLTESKMNFLFWNIISFSGCYIFLFLRLGSQDCLLH